MGRGRGVRWRAVATALVPVVAVLAWLAVGRSGPVVDVAGGADLASAAREVGTGGTVRLAPGRYDGTVIDVPGVRLRGDPDGRSTVVGTLQLAADDLVVEDVAVQTGERSGVVVREVDGVVLKRVAVAGPRLHGIELIDASGSITDCAVTMSGQYTQGIEIRNATGRPRTVIRGCTVSGGAREGIVAHSARVEVLDNTVRGTWLNAIAITEMSEGLVARNHVLDAAGRGLFCGDMAHCEWRDNVVEDVADNGSGVVSQRGREAVVWYYSTARLRGNTLAGVPSDEALLMQGSVTVDRFPLGIWAPGWRGLFPGVPVALAIAAGVLLAGRALARRADRGWTMTAGGAIVGWFLAGLVSQTFHMAEHVVQVWQINVADAEVRSGLVGQLASVEWVHFGYNAVVLGLLVAVWLRRRELPSRAAPWLAVAAIVQGYHLFEHTVRIWQHLAEGLSPAPGVLGPVLGLVWFHFGINVVVYAAQVVVAWWLWQHRDRVSLRAPRRRLAYGSS